jgi:hypothetical protein
VTADLAALRLTRTKINAGIWVCAAIAMIASAISGVTTFHTLQKDGWGLASGLATALAVDVALWVVLTGDRQLQILGLQSGGWARTMRWGTAAASLVLNCTAAWIAGQPMLVAVHAIVPLIMVGLSEYSGECAARFTAALTEIEAQERAANTPIVAPSERIAAASSQPALNIQRPLQLQTPDPTVTPFAYRSEQPARLHPDQGKRIRSSREQRPGLRVSAATTKQPAARRSNVRDIAFDWLDANHGSDTTARKLAEGIGGSEHTCKKLLGEWRRQKAAS